jgi:hypothetical protein
MRILKSGAAGRPNQHEYAKNGEPGPECAQPGGRHGDELSLFDSEGSFGPMRKQKHPFLANKNWSKQDAWKL